MLRAKFHTYHNIFHEKPVITFTNECVVTNDPFWTDVVELNTTIALGMELGDEEANIGEK